jgi:hypothetical protein
LTDGVLLGLCSASAVSSFLPVPRLGLVNPEGYIALSLFPHLSAIPPVMSYYRKLWIRCGNERGGVPFRVDHANPGGSRVEGDATDAEGNGKRDFKGSQPGVV